MFKFLKKIRWKSVLITGALLILAVLSCFYFHYEFQSKTGLWYRRKMLIYVAPMVVAFLLSFFMPTIRPKWHLFSRTLFVMLTIVLAADVFQRMAWDEPLVYWVKMPLRFVLMNISITAVIFMAVWALVWDSRIAAQVLFWLMYVLGYLYFCVGQLRGATLKLVDLNMLGTAMAVAGKYRFSLKARHVFWAMFGVNLLLIGRWVPRLKNRTCRMKLCKLGCMVAAGVWMYVLISTPLLDKMDVKTTSWEPDAKYYNALQGALTTLMKEGWELQNMQPEGYSVKALQVQEPGLMQAGWTREGTVRPNVLVIMNESLADLTKLWQIEARPDPLESIRALMENSVHGNLYVSSYGGSTCNTEHSFLTGTIPKPAQMLYLMPSVNESTPSLAWQLKVQGYRTFAIHPEKAENYQRNLYYPLLGLDTFLSISDFPNAERMRGHVTDRECYEKIISLYEQKQDDERIFVFNVTMQNHSSDVLDGLPDIVSLSKEDAKLEEYFNSVYQSAAAFRELCSYFEQQEEPTVILMFGDHQPALNLNGYEKQSELTDSEEYFTQYITPFVIWANYSIEAEHVEALSVNYLAALLLEKAGLPLSAYDEWQLEMAQQYPVVLLHGYVDTDGQTAVWDEEVSRWHQKLKRMEDVRYNRLHDEKNRLPALRRLETMQ